MIIKWTEFKNLNEKKELTFDIQAPIEIKNRIVDDLSFLVWKGKKRNGKKNYKSIRLINFSGTYDNNDLTSNSSERDIYFKLTLSNNDYIEAKYTRKTNIETVTDSNIFIEINSKIIFDIDNIEYDEDAFYRKIREVYILYLEKKNWKIKE